MEAKLIVECVFLVVGLALMLSRHLLRMSVNCRLLERVYRGERVIYPINEKKVRRLERVKAFVDDKANPEMYKIGCREDTFTESILGGGGFFLFFIGVGFIVYSFLKGFIEDITTPWMLGKSLSLQFGIGIFIPAVLQCFVLGLLTEGINALLALAVDHFAGRRANELYERYHSRDEYPSCDRPYGVEE